jgi:hypothetical protein
LPSPPNLRRINSEYIVYRISYIVKKEKERKEELGIQESEARIKYSDK